MMTMETILRRFELRGGVVCHKLPVYGHGGRKAAGSPAGYVAGNGYIMCCVKGDRLHAHRIAWALVHGVIPTTDIDHIDGDKQNNAPSNLRLATRSQNNYNAKKRRDNTSGYKGVSFDKARGKWDARFNVKGKTVHLGRFATAEQAKAAYDKAASALRGDFHKAA